MVYEGFTAIGVSNALGTNVGVMPEDAAMSCVSVDDELRMGNADWPSLNPWVWPSRVDVHDRASTHLALEYPTCEARHLRQADHLRSQCQLVQVQIGG